MVGSWGEGFAFIELLDVMAFAEKLFSDDDYLIFQQLLRSMDLRWMPMEVLQLLRDPAFYLSRDWWNPIDSMSNGRGFECASAIRNARDFFEQRLVFGGINFDPLFAKFVLYPLAGMIFIPLTELLVVGPLSGITILSQVTQEEEEEEEEEEERRGGYINTNININKALLRRKLTCFACRFAFFGITSSAPLCFDALLKIRWPEMRAGDLCIASAGLTALTASIVLLPLDTLRIRMVTQPSENYMRTLCARLPKIILVTLPSMAIGLSVYDLVLLFVSDPRPQGGATTRTVTSRIMLRLTWSCVVSLAVEIFGGAQRGNLVSVAHRLTFYSVNHLAYLIFKTLLTSVVPSSIPRPTVAFVSGGLAASTATLISHPLDTLRTHILVNTSENYRGAFRDICKDGGFRSLYAGISTSLLGIIPSMTMNVLVYETASLFWGVPRPDKSSTMFDLACGTIAGIIASLVTCPIEVVQRRMQVEAGKEDSEKEPSLGLREILATIIDKEGVGGLYRGIRPHIIKVVVGHAAAFTAYEAVKIPCCWANILFRVICDRI